jgi:hypothetical protein
MLTQRWRNSHWNTEIRIFFLFFRVFFGQIFFPATTSARVESENAGFTPKNGILFRLTGLGD